MPERSSAEVLTFAAWSLMASTVPRSLSVTALVFRMSSPSSSSRSLIFFVRSLPSSPRSSSFLRFPSEREAEATLILSMKPVMPLAMKKAIISMIRMMTSITMRLMMRVRVAACLMEASETPAKTDPMTPFDLDFRGT